MFDKIMQEMRLPYKALVAFSGTVKDGETGMEYTAAPTDGGEIVEVLLGNYPLIVIVVENFAFEQRQIVGIGFLFLRYLEFRKDCQTFKSLFNLLSHIKRFYDEQFIRWRSTLSSSLRSMPKVSLSVLMMTDRYSLSSLGCACRRFRRHPLGRQMGRRKGKSLSDT